MTRSHRCSFCGTKSTDEICADTPPALPTPALDQLIHSNTPPTHGLESLVKTQLALVQDRIKTIDEAIDHLQKARSSLEQEENNLASVMSPVRRIPPEILSEIFILYFESWWERLSEWQLRGALPTDEYMGWDDFENLEEWDSWMDEETRDKKSDRDLTDPALRPTNVLSRVCHSWRTAAHTCSSLWSDIFIHHDYRLPATQTLLKAQLRLSVNRPLRVHTSYKFMHDQHLFPLLQGILPTSHRWTSISMVIDDPNHPVFPRSAMPSPFPSLVSLSLILKRAVICNRPVDDVEHIYTITAADAPLLRAVSLSWPDYAALNFDLPWAQLHKLRLWGGDGARAVEIISCLRDIVELDLVGLTEYDESLDSLPLRSLHLPSLRCLRLSNVGCHDSDTPGMILPYLRVPSLHTLCWTGMKYNDMKELYKMCAPQCPGRSGRAPAEGQKVIRHFHLYNPMRDTLETQMHCHRESWGLWLDAMGPQLKSLKIEYPTSSGVDASGVIEHLANRIRGGSLPDFHACTLQGAHISSSSLADLITCVESHKCDIRVFNCSFDTQEELDGACMTSLRESFPKVVPDGAFFELDVEAPNRKRLFYTSELGSGLEGGCECRLKGMSLQRDSRSSVLRVI